MADLTEVLLVKTAQNFKGVLDSFDPSGKLRHHSASSTLLNSIKTFHDHVHLFDAASGDQVISELVTEALDDEQVWQQQELQLGAAKKFINEQSVQKLEQLNLRFNSVSGSKETENMDDLSDVDNVMDTDGSDSPHLTSGEDSDPEIEKIKKNLKDREGLTMGSESDDELFKGAEEDWLEEEEDDSQQKSGKQKAHANRKSVVDDKFFKLADMDEFVNQEIKKDLQKQNREKNAADEDDSDSEEESDDDTQNLDMFTEWSDDETGKEAMYSDFFDPPVEEADVQQATRKASGQASGEGEEEENEASEMSDEDLEMMDLFDEEETKDTMKKVRFSKDTKSANEENKQQQAHSNFEKRMEKLSQQITDLEQQSLESKPWQMMGEVEARARPENSLLEEIVEFRQAAPKAAEITEEVTTSIDDIIRQRLRQKVYDDNTRQVRPREEAFQLKTERTLDQEKSKLSLHEVYEQEFLKLQAPEEEETNPRHEEIKKMMMHLFPRLDALASWQYTPLQAVPEIKIKSNLPAVQMEEATPIVMSDATLLAPEEIHEKKKGELKGKTETTKTDRLRQRKQKKAAKRQRKKEKEKREKAVEKMNPGLGNKYSKQRALEQLEKEASGNIEVITEKKSKKSFFRQLEDVTRQGKSSKTDRKKKAGKSSSKLLL